MTHEAISEPPTLMGEDFFALLDMLLSSVSATTVQRGGHSEASLVGPLGCDRAAEVSQVHHGLNMHHGLHG